MHWKNNLLAHQRALFHEKLTPLYSEEERDSLFFWCVEEYLGLSRLAVSQHPEKRLSESEILKFHFALKQLATGKPIQYVFGKTEFYGFPFLVNEHVLIPRPETEELVLWVLEEIQDTHTELLDIGTGSGCIPIALKKKNPKWKVSACDVSPQAISVAKENAKHNGVEVYIFLCDILQKDALPSALKPKVIISNPPYITEKEKNTIHRNVLDYEPQKALFPPGDDPLIFYKKIVEIAMKLSSCKALFFEINQYLKPKLEAWLKDQNFFKIQFKKDISGNWRMVYLVK